ncbi:hypothetical protein M0813_06249 [Anaeramoeba flamelloides]|uniref:Homeobox domain-containing protein n=1 Tax=Anaeramoeba flamelloides TaxID=1746091 RepID=A0ABQ8XIN1_9EUKA|nr:hypothetical protein M0813_06249 [Anaeramoeba flamelloides]
MTDSDKETDQTNDKWKQTLNKGVGFGSDLEQETTSFQVPLLKTDQLNSYNSDFEETFFSSLPRTHSVELLSGLTSLFDTVDRSYNKKDSLFKDDLNRSDYTFLSPNPKSKQKEKVLMPLSEEHNDRKLIKKNSFYACNNNGQLKKLIKELSFNNGNELVSMVNSSVIKDLNLMAPTTRTLDFKFKQLIDSTNKKDEKKKKGLVTRYQNYKNDWEMINQSKKCYLNHIFNMSTPFEDILQEKGGIEKIKERFEQFYRILDKETQNNLNQYLKECSEKNNCHSKPEREKRNNVDKFGLRKRLYQIDNDDLDNYNNDNNFQLNNNLKEKEKEKENENEKEQEQEQERGKEKEKNTKKKNKVNSFNLNSDPDPDPDPDSDSDSDSDSDPGSDSDLDSDIDYNNKKKSNKTQEKTKKETKNLVNVSDEEGNLIKNKSLEIYYDEFNKLKIKLKRRRRNKRYKTTNLAKEIFEKWFQEHYNDKGGPYPDKSTREILAEKSQIPELQVQRWFGQRRRIEKDKFKNGEINKPQWI